MLIGYKWLVWMLKGEVEGELKSYGGHISEIQN